MQRILGWRITKVNIGASGVQFAAGETFHAIATIHVMIAAKADTGLKTVKDVIAAANVQASLDKLHAYLGV